MRSFVSINKLILVGVRKNYIIPFFPGVNIIYGDSDTGKSSILEFINYLLGSGSIELADEVISSAKYAALELIINDNLYTIKRNIFKHDDFIEVYRCDFDSCATQYPEKYAPKFNGKPAPNGFFSDFMMDSLGLAKLRMKVAPTQADSDLRRLSFRNLFQYSYLNQDDVGSKGFLDQGNWVKAVASKEVFKYIFNVLDTSIAEIEAEISVKSKEEIKISQKYEAVSEFLRETDYKGMISIEDSIGAIDGQIESLSSDLDRINKAMVANYETYNELKAVHNELSLKEKAAKQTIYDTSRKIDQYSRLKNDYDNDINKINSILLSQKKLGEHCKNPSNCPICEQEIKIDTIPFELSNELTLENELKSLTKRQRGIRDIIKGLSEKNKQSIKDLSDCQMKIVKVAEVIDHESREMITPYLTQRDALVKKLHHCSK